MNILLTDIQRFCMHDGPGIRTTVFLKGCPLRCKWCHNPETQEAKKQLLFDAKKCMNCRSCMICKEGVHRFTPEHLLNRAACKACGACAAVCPVNALEISGNSIDTEAVFEEICRDLAFYTDGGVTLSGGEPFFQPSPTLYLLERCHHAGISTAVETCGFFDPSILPRAVRCTDLFLWDVKDTDSQRHQIYTGVSNGPILINLRKADALGGRSRLRCILVQGVNTCDTHYHALAELAGSLRCCEEIEFLPYHAYAGSKNTVLGKADNGNIGWIPKKETMERAKAVIKAAGIPLFEG